MQPKPVADKNHLIWIDLEMTGLNPDSDVIIEIATIVTDSDLNVLAEGPSLADTSITSGDGCNGQLEHAPTRPQWSHRARVEQ
jgi:oligoribonuclease (3'-5' exoribonuclease)